MKRKIVFISFLVLIGFIAPAQEFTITKVELLEQSIVVHYDLLDTARNKAYVIYAYSSKDQFLNPLQKVSGDVGPEIRPGKNKRLEWRAKEELGDTFEGGVEIEIRGRLYVPFIRIENLSQGVSVRRGVKKKLVWSGGRTQYLNFNLVRDEKIIETITNIPNTREYDLLLPTSIKPGKNYYFIVTDSKIKDQVYKSNMFHVKRKVPLLLKVVPGAAIVAAALLLAPKSKNRELEKPLPPPTDLE